MKRFYSLALIVSASFALISLGGCSTAVKLYDSYYMDSHNRAAFNYKAGSTHVAVLSITPWENIMASLQPNFPMTAEIALDKSIPTTMKYEQKMVDAMIAKLTLTPPMTSMTTNITTTTNALGTTSTETKTRTKEPGKVPTSENTPSTLNEPSSPSGNSIKNVMEGDLGLDPMVKYTAANALYQEVKLLNRYVSDAAVNNNSKAYVLRLQVSVMPHKRNMPYDTYIDISFLNKEPKGGDDLTIIPLLVTDDLESLSSSRSIETIRQIGLSVTAMIQGTGAKADLDKIKKNLENIRGQSMNSLLTVARATDNTLRVRLGAMQQGNSLYAAVPRTHNISVLLLVPNKAFNGNGKEAEIILASLTRFYDTINGKALPDSKGNIAVENERIELLKEFDFGSDKNNIKLLEKMEECINNNDFHCFKTKYSDLKKNKDKDSGSISRTPSISKSNSTNATGNAEPEKPSSELFDFYSFVSNGFVGSVTQDTRINIQKSQGNIPEQTVIASDDGEKITATINRARGCLPRNIESANLNLVNTNIKDIQTSTIIPTEANGLTLIFPSLSFLEASEKMTIAKGKIDGKDMFLNLISKSSPEGCQKTFSVYYHKVKNQETTQPSIKLSINAKQIVSKDGRGKLDMQFKGVSDEKYTLAANAEMKNFTPQNVIDPATYKILKDGKVSIDLSNINQSEMVTFKILSEDGTTVIEKSVEVK